MLCRLATSQNDFTVISLRFLTFLLLYKGLVINYGEGRWLQNGMGASQVSPLHIGRMEEVLAMLKRGHKKF